MGNRGYEQYRQRRGLDRAVPVTKDVGDGQEIVTHHTLPTVELDMKDEAGNDISLYDED